MMKTTVKYSNILMMVTNTMKFKLLDFNDGNQHNEVQTTSKNTVQQH